MNPQESTAAVGMVRGCLCGIGGGLTGSTRAITGMLQAFQRAGTSVPFSCFTPKHLKYALASLLQQ